MQETNYKKRIEKWNKSVEIHKRSPAHVDGVFERPAFPNYVVTRGVISVPSLPLQKSEEKKSDRVKFTQLLFQKRNFYLSLLSTLLIILNIAVPLTAFEAHVLNVTATIKQRTCSVVTFDTDASGTAISSGQTIDSEYDDWGLNISADNNHANIPDLAIAFGSDAPTGGDFDLGTPNTDFGGPGVGIGGGVGQPGENTRLEHNLLVIAQDNVDSNNDGLVDDPSDEPDGGWIWFDFDAPTRVESLRLLDIETAGTKVEVYNGAEILDATFIIPTHGDNSSQYLDINKDDVKKIGVWLSGEGAVDSLCFDPIEKPNMCDALSKGYWANNEGCSHGTGESLWASEVNDLSDDFSDVFTSTTASGICEALWTPNCPSGNTTAAKLCKAKSHLLADELNVVSGHLAPTAFIAGAVDGHSAFSHLGLTPFSTIEQALGMIEAVLNNPASTKNQINDAGYVAQRIYEFYENENPFRPQCIFEPEEVTQCLASHNIKIDIENDATVINNVTTTSNTGGNSANGGDAHSSSSSGNSNAQGGDGGTIVTGNATSESTVTNIVNNTVIEIGGTADIQVETNGGLDIVIPPITIDEIVEPDALLIPEIPEIPKLEELSVITEPTTPESEEDSEVSPQDDSTLSTAQEEPQTVQGEPTDI